MPRRVALHRAREALVMEERPAPAPGPGEVGLRLEACALGQLDWNLLTLDAPPRLPLVPGHEAVARVEAAGEGVTLPVGQRVLVTPLAAWCGTCARCLEGAPRWCEAARWRGVHDDGVLAEAFVAREAALVPLAPTAVPTAWLALAGGSLWTAVGALGGVVAGDTVGVFGVGGVGHLAVQVARARGCRVLARDVDPLRQRLAERLGAAPLSGPVDVAVVATPSAQAAQAAVRAVRRGGRVVLLGTSPAGRLDLSLGEVVWRGVHLEGALLGAAAALREGLALLESGAVRPEVEVVPLADVPARLWALRDLGFGGRLVVVP